MVRIKKAWNMVRIWLANVFLSVSVKICPELYVAFIQEHGNKLGMDLAQRGIRHWLETEMVSFCNMCLSRHQLRKRDGKWFCYKHDPKEQRPPVAANIAPGGKITLTSDSENPVAPAEKVEVA